MKTIFIQVKCELGKAYEVAGRLSELGGVSEVFSTSGRYDLFIKCYLENDDDAGRYVSEKIQPTKGIAETYTLIAFSAFN